MFHAQYIDGWVNVRHLFVANVQNSMIKNWSMFVQGNVGNDSTIDTGLSHSISLCFSLDFSEELVTELRAFYHTTRPYRKCPHVDFIYRECVSSRIVHICIRKSVIKPRFVWISYVVFVKKLNRFGHSFHHGLSNWIFVFLNLSSPFLGNIFFLNCYFSVRSVMSSCARSYNVKEAVQ